MKVLLLLIVLLSALPLCMAAAEYNRGDDGKSTRWKDADRPSHWYSKDTYGEKKHSDMWKKKRFDRPDKQRRHFVPFNRVHKFHPVIIYRQRSLEPPREVEEVTVTPPRYIPVPQPLSPRRCAGDVVYTRNSTTGEVTINFVSPAGEC